MVMIFRCAVAAAALASSVAGQAQPQSGAAQPKLEYAHISSLTAAQLSRICEKDDSENSRAGVALSACNAYILGVADQQAIDRVFCLDSPSYATKVITEVRQYLRQHPGRGEAPPVSVIRDALAAAFPCDHD